MTERYDKELSQWVDNEKTTLELQHLASKLLLERDVELVLFRRKFFDKKLSEIIHDHNYLSEFSGVRLSTTLSRDLAQAIADLSIAPSKIDLGRLSSEFQKDGNQYPSVAEFVKHKLADFIGADKKKLVPRDVVLYGFGRIGRLAARILMDHAGSGHQLRLKGIVTRERSTDDLAKRASLLRKDSVHGKFGGVVLPDPDNNAININGHSVKMISAASPAEIDYTQYGIDNAIVIDNTGVWRDEKGLGVTVYLTIPEGSCGA